MRTHTTQFKENIKKFGKELDSLIRYSDSSSGAIETIELGSEELNSVSLHYEGNILKSVMKQLDVDCVEEIPIGTNLTYLLGVKTRNDEVEDYRDNYDYINYGNFIVKNVEKQEDTNSYKITCYDKMLYSMIDYETMNITYPTTIRNYINAVCNKLGLTFKNVNDIFANYDKEITSELYLSYNNETEKYTSIGYKFRDVLDELAQVTASTICINNNDELEIRYINDTKDTIDEEYLKDINVKFGEKYGPINTIVLTRSGGSDSIYYPATLPENPIEIKIEDNQIMNGNNRDEYLPDIYNKLNGLEYYINDYSSTGVCYYDLCDKYNVSIGENIYPCIMFNDEINVTQGLEENVYVEIPEQAKTDYSKADSTDRKINTAYVLADKANSQLEEVARRLNEDEESWRETKRLQDEFGETFEVIKGNFDDDGNATKVKTTNGYTFNEEGFNIYTSEDTFNTQITNSGMYFKDGSTDVGQYTKDGSKQKDLYLFGVYYYGMKEINNTPMFVAQLYTDNNGEECFGHFYNRGD